MARAPLRRRRVLVVDDDPVTVDWLRMVVEQAQVEPPFEVRSASLGRVGETIFDEWRPEIVLLDLLLPDGDGLSVLKRMKERAPGTEVIVISGQGTIARALDAGQAGAFFFVEKSQLDPDGLVSILERAGRQVDERVTHEELRAKLRDPDGMGAIVGQSQVMRELFELVDAVAPSNANVLIQGENGTGKELIANALHQRSPRARGPFIKINCAAIPKDLIESELFGYKKGAFTGASSDKIGLFELAEGGALMLDEIGEMPAYLQTKLLRVLQEREYRPIGGDRFVKVDFRLICATNIDLDAALRDGRLREDLYFRINTIVAAGAAAARAARGHPAAVGLVRREVRPPPSEGGARGQPGRLPPADPQPLARQRARARERDGAGGAGRRARPRSSRATCPSRCAPPRPTTPSRSRPTAPWPRSSGWPSCRRSSAPTGTSRRPRRSSGSTVRRSTTRCAGTASCCAIASGRNVAAMGEV